MSTAGVPVTRLVITGMSCAGCVARVEKALKAVPGVIDASVNLVSQQADVRGAVSSEQLVNAVASLGYGARINAVTDPTAASHSDAAVVEVTPDARPWRDVILSASLTAPLVLPMLVVPLGLHWQIPAFLQAILATTVQTVFGARFYRASWLALRHGNATMDVLVALGTSVAWLLSLYLWLYIPGQSHALYFETSSVIITLVLLGKQLEERARHRTRSAVEALGKLQPLTARRIYNNKEYTVAATVLITGDLVRVLAGETLPADGKVLQGASQIDESMLTGESLPVTRKVGDRVTAGTVVLDGTLDVAVTASGQDTTLSRIIAWVDAAQGAKAPVQKLADRISAIFVPMVIGLALLTLTTLALSGYGWEEAMVRAITVLVIACPCALGLAVPVALMAGTGAAARAGILIRDIDALERAAHIDVVAFDKTGTLTVGRPTLQTVKGAGMDETTLIATATGLQACSTHPLAQAFRHHAESLGIRPARVNDPRQIAGLGVSGSVGDTPWILGNDAWLARHGLDTDPWRHHSEASSNRGETPVWLARLAPAPTIEAFFGLADTPREDAAPTVQRLQDLGIESLMITGDNPQSARWIANQTGINTLHAGVLPEGKAEIITSIRQKGRHIAMVGDGINDAPALASADLGIALGSGTDIARHSAAITLVGHGLARVPDALEIARRTRNALRQNLFFAFAYNIIGIPLAMAGMLNPMIAGAAMAASSLSVIANALRLNRWRPRPDTIARAHTIPGPSPV